MKKPKKDKDKEDKRKAFMSFLEEPSTATDSVILEAERKNASDIEEYEEEYVEDTNRCNICSDPLDSVKKKKCGFCNMEICNKHLRKRRKLNKKFQRVCDTCEDKQLYENYMKLELKAQEALMTQQEIIEMKHSEFQGQANERKAKWKQMAFRSEQIKEKHEKKSKQLQKQEDQISIKQHAFEKRVVQNKQLQLFVERASQSMIENYEEDYKILTIENQKLGKDLANLDKRRSQVLKALQKRQKQIEQAYEEWEKREYMRNQSKNNKKQQRQKKQCAIY